MMAGLGEVMGFDVNTPWRKLPAKARKAILEGCDEQVHVRYRNRYGRTRSYYADFEGVMAFLQRKMQQTESDMMKERYEGFMRDVPCPVCQGTRLKPEILAVTLAAGDRGKKSIAEVCDLSISECADFLQHLTLDPVNKPSPGRCSRKSCRGSGSCSTSGWTTCRCHGLPRRWPAEKHNASGWPHRSVRAWWGCSTFSMSRRSACTSATTVGSSKRSPA
ncbi:uvrABC system A domain protein [Mycobacterium xenopi 3993]|nr:uvrABC system A domain protein [Mycobacterium xenopi 3993]